MSAKKGNSNISLAIHNFILRVTTGEDAGMIFALSKDKMVVGRSQVGMPDIEIHEIYAAPRHFTIYWDESVDSHVIQDLGNINKVYINDFPLDSREMKELRLDDKIRVGNTTFVYEKKKRNK